MLVTAGTTLQCSFGAAPVPLSVLPVNCVLAGAPAATVMDNVPMVNVMPFGMCSCPANPTVTAVPGSPTVMIGGMPALQNASKLMCTWGGVIQVVAPAQVTTMVP